MSFEEALEIIDDLSYSQGFYGRLKRDLIAMDEESQKQFEKSIKDCKTSLDLILWLEGGLV